MSFLAKLWAASSSGSSSGNSARLSAPAEPPRQRPQPLLQLQEQKQQPQQPPQHHDKKCLQFGSDPVRILLFRDCESRMNHALLFDSMLLEKCRHCAAKVAAPGNPGTTSCQHNAKQTLTNPSSKAPLQLDNVNGKSFELNVCEHDKLLSEDTKLLNEMTFGSVAMMYKGPSFKIHVGNSPPSIICTKVFPYTEHSVCKPSQQHSSETLGTWTNFEANSSNSSLRNQLSRPGSGNVSGNSLSRALRKSSTCSSTGSGWDIEVPRLGSSQSLESGATGLHGSGSLSSLRRRWLRAVSTSLSRSESEDGLEALAYDQLECQGNGKHKTRLGLVLLLQLPTGREQETMSVFLEHAALLEGMLDRLRYSCSKGPRQSLVRRLQRASHSSTIRLLRRIMRLDTEIQPRLLLWHNVLLNSSRDSSDVSLGAVHRSLQQMCWLLEKYDTKSTNFFISTIVTAVLTHHLGWVHTAPPCRDKQLLDKMGKQYACNPLWAQLADLYGAVGTPSRVAQTVIAAEPEKASLIESVLHFLSYFVRSGIVEKQLDSARPEPAYLQEAKTALERALRDNPVIQQGPAVKRSPFDLPSKRPLKSSGRRVKQQQPSPSLLLNSISRGSSTSSSSSSSVPSFNGQTRERQIKLGQTSSANGLGADPIHQDTYGFAEAQKKEKTEGEERQEGKEEEEASSKKLKRSATKHDRLSDFGLKAKKPPGQVEPLPAPALDERQATSKVKIIVIDEDERKLCQINKATPNNEPALEQLALEAKLAYIDRQKLSAFVNRNSNSKTFEEAGFAAYQSSLAEDTRSDLSKNQQQQVYFTLGDEKPGLSIHERLKSSCRCQCSYTFTRVPSTSAELPEGVLRKIIQRNFPESSKSMGPPREDEPGACLRCRSRAAGQGGQAAPGGPREQGNAGKPLETPTNATEVLRGCGAACSSEEAPLRLSPSRAAAAEVSPDSLEDLLAASGIVELPMPRSESVRRTGALQRPERKVRVGFPRSLIGLRPENPSGEQLYSGYTWGMAVQGLTKKRASQPRQSGEDPEEEWWQAIRENLGFAVKFPLLDQPVSEALCIIGDLDSWQVGLLSNASSLTAPTSVGMSRLVSDMLEAFVYMWKTLRSPELCIKFLESRLREMWMRSLTLADFLLTADLDDASVRNLTDFLDVDAADLPLLVAVASTHTPQISQRFGLTLA